MVVNKKNQQGFENEASTVFEESIVIVHVEFVPALAQSPPQPIKVPKAGSAVKVTDVPSANEAVQADGPAQVLIPDGEVVTEPFEPQLCVTLTVTDCSNMKLAVTLREELITTVQLPVPLQPSPDQFVKADPEPALALSVTLVPSL